LREFKGMLVRPLRAIRYHCYDCSGWNWNEVRKCPHQDCILWPYRTGHRPKKPKYDKVSGESYRKLIQAS